jgi:hypothetical protein
MESLGEFIKVLGGVAGIVALVWRFVDEFGTWLRISVNVTSPTDGWMSVLTSVDNNSNRPKPIEFACLLVSPECENPVAAAAELARALGSSTDIKYTNDIEKLKPDLKGRENSAPIFDNGRVLLPLPFYYSENVGIGDETLTYRVQLDSSRLLPATCYAVRFFIFVRGRLHRSTHDSFFNKAVPPTA